ELLSTWGIKSDVIPNALKFHAYKKEVFNKVALAVGRLDEQKGFDILLSIWSRFIVENPGWKLMIAGDGILKNDLLNQSRELNIENSVNFLGLVHNIDEYYKNSDILLMTSRYEGLPLVLLEAKSWSLPCIAFDCPTGPSEIISNGKDGFIVPMHDENQFLNKLNKLAKDHDIRNEFSANTFYTSRKFERDNIINLWKSLI
ncbi:glycosyltransferase, partial [Pluralibacter gergoviae]|nr:glycosyltransferase [Pluralibacter gergoviae]